MAKSESERRIAPKNVVYPPLDGRELLSPQDVSELLDTPKRTILTAAKRGKLHPAKFGRRLYFTRSEVVAWHRDRRGEGEKLDRERAMIARFAEGAHPVDVFLETSGVTLKDTLKTLHDWAAVAGIWVVEGPRGSYARWLKRMGLVELQPREMRRVIEALLADPYVAKVAGLALDQTRAATVLAAASMATTDGAGDGHGDAAGGTHSQPASASRVPRRRRKDGEQR